MIRTSLPGSFAPAASSSSSEQSARIVRILEEYMAVLERGGRPDPEGLLARYPDLADVLPDYLRDLEQLHTAAVNLRDSLPSRTGRPAVEPIPETEYLGDFRLIREIGRGGMGVVYEAEQLSLGRKVALKVLPLAAALDSKQLQRFQVEAHAAACLHHTNIVPIHAVGCERGVPFYAMQLIEGRSLAELIRELRQLEGLDLEPDRSPEKGRLASPDIPNPAAEPPRVGRGSPDPAPPATEGLPRLATTSKGSTRSRPYIQTVARLGIQAAEALEHAHQRGVLHRDIKPANLLLDAQGTLWVTDFGLARLPGDVGLTATGDLLGTLRYMSPEQALGNRVMIDGRTDIYSLGVTLYELVTLRPAVDGADRQEILRKIAQDEPVPPRKRNPAIPRELETILLKAIDKEPGLRYATAQELADDLRRFLEDKPIRARRPTAWDHVVKWSRRHKPLIGSAAAVLMLAVVALSTGMVVLARKQAELERQRDAARQAVDDMYTDVAEQWLEQQAALEPMQRKFLQKALDYYQRFAGEQSTDLKVRLNTGVAYRRVGRVQRKLGRFGEAEAAHRRALTILEKLVIDTPVAGCRSELASSHDSLGGLLAKTGRYEEAEREYRRAVAVREELVAESPSLPQYRSDLARSCMNLGWLLSSTVRKAEAEQEYRRAIALLDKLTVELPALPGYLSELAQSKNLGNGTATLMYAIEGELGASHDNLGNLLSLTGREEEAVREYGRAIELRQKLAADSPSVPVNRSDLAASHRNLGNVLNDMRRLADAEKEYGQAIALHDRLVSDSPSVAEYRHDLALDLLGLGVMVFRTGRFAEAEAPSRRAIELLEKLANEFPSVDRYRGDLALCHNLVGAVLTETNRPAEAEPALRRATDLYTKLAADSPAVSDYRSDLAMSLGNLGANLTPSGRDAEAEPAYRQSIALLGKLATESASEPRHRNYLADHLDHLGKLLQRTGRLAEAEQALSQAVALFEKLVAECPSVAEYQGRLARSNAHLAILLGAAGRWDEAEKSLHCALARADQLQDADSQDELARALATYLDPRFRDPQLALRLVKKALEQEPRSSSHWNTLGVANYRLGDWKAAIKALEKSMELGGRGSPTDWLFLAMAHWQLGDKDQAKKLYTQAIDSMEKNKSQDEELRRFRAEASALLCLTDQPTASENKEEHTTRHSKP